MIELMLLAGGVLVGVLITAWAATGQYDKGYDDAIADVQSGRLVR